MFWKGTEQQHAMDIVVLIHLLNLCQQILLRYICGKKNLLTGNPQCLAALCGASLIRDIAFIFPYTNDSQSRFYAFFF